MKIMTNFVPDQVDYLTPGKLYDDQGDDLLIIFASSAHLDGAAWEIVE